MTIFKKPRIGDIRIINADRENGTECFMVCEVDAVDSQGVARYRIWKGDFDTFDAAKSYIRMTLTAQGKTSEWT